MAGPSRHIPHTAAVERREEIPLVNLSVLPLFFEHPFKHYHTKKVNRKAVVMVL